ncbi:LLM class flavin-dependent oxidoreductase [Streptomyces sp. ISL-10]|uniref:LLM class flavin-dependent oxidoreductase n=1 Tax=Streptomyces sp. ISL-10 TaxID=2819172 RepID=UPI001BE5A697|nr:LLM class flavin-dependent oxidoreductase [Streptomyces sp. ISL-10]MBT2367952.1 LLM class flavin-dependent oxidoreductase [Streptomyces sp. ISL-10]
MKLGVNLTYQGAGELAVAAEQLGYDVALAPEGHRSDAASVLGLVAGRTERIGLCSGVMQIPARTPALAGLTAATLQALSGGRFRLGLGVSNPDVSEGWYGVPFAEPLARTREYVEVVRLALRGQPVRYEGRHYQLPSSGSGAAPLHVITEWEGPTTPVYLGAVGPRNLSLAGEIADGWIGVFATPEQVAGSVAQIAEGRKHAGRPLAGFDVMPCLATAVGEDVNSCVDRLRAHYAYLMGIGSRDRNFYCGLATRMGHGEGAAEVSRLMAIGDRAGAARAVPAAFIDETSLVGPVERIGQQMRAYADAGVTTLSIMISAVQAGLDQRITMLEQAMEALELSGVRG